MEQNLLIFMSALLVTAAIIATYVFDTKEFNRKVSNMFFHVALNDEQNKILEQLLAVNDWKELDDLPSKLFAIYRKTNAPK